MNSSEFDQWCSQQQLTASALDLIATIRSAPPSRRVQGRAKNVSGVYPSRKMGQTIQFESHTVELWAIYQMEHEEEVLEFYDQPPPFKIQYHNKTGRKIGHYHTPDFFVLRTDGAAWEEWKTETSLKRLAEKYPGRYQKTADGKWHSPPGTAHAESYGLKYHIRTDSELHPIFTQNLIFLEDYLLFNTNIPHTITEQILTAVQAKPGITITATLASIPGIRANDIYAMIATEQLYVNLYASPLVEHWRVQLYPDQQTHQAYTHLAITTQDHQPIPAPTALLPSTVLLWDSKPWTLVNFGTTTTTLLPEIGQPIQLPTAYFLQLLESGNIKIQNSEKQVSINNAVQALMDAASPSDLSQANHRYHLVQAYIQRHADIYKDIPASTLKRWVKQFREAEAKYGCGYVGLLPRTNRRGNRQPKAPNQSSELLDKFITEHFETPRQAPAASVYRLYVRACNELNIQPLSSRTFYHRLKQRPIHEQTKKRQGAKAAYSTEPKILELTLTTPRHGDRPFAIAHIDHTLLDIELRSIATGRNLGRPWLTLLIDAYSRRILALYLTFDPPSYRSCMMALRSCVQRFGRFPQAVVVDGGKEFHSIYFDTLLARYHCIKKTRPGGKPRFGSVIERLFGTTNTEFVYNLLGNTQASKQPRQITSSVDPKQQAVWTLADLYTYLTEWAYTIYDTSEHDSLGATPLQVYTDSLLIAGEREHRHIAYNEDFLMATRPSTAKGTAKVQPGQGIKVNYLYYWSDAFRNPAVEKTKVPVRYDPFDMGVAYAYLEGRWVKCISQYYMILDEAQHLMKIGSGASGGKLLDQLDWIKSMTNVTGVLHILIGTYELLNFRNLSGQASRRGLDIHFPRYLFQHEQERQDFQGILLALLKQVPLEIDIPALMQHWVYFYERSIGCVGVLKDWLIRSVAAALHDGADSLTLERLHEHTLSLAQCERMAIEATEGEQKLCYMESRREHLWHLLQMGMTSTSVPGGIVDLSPLSKSTVAPVSNASATSKSTRKKRSDAQTVQANTPNPVSMAGSPEPKKKQTRKKKEASVAVTETMQDSQETTQDTQTSMTEVAEVATPPKKRQTRKKKESAVVSEQMPQDTQSSEPVMVSLTTELSTVEAVPKKNGRRSVGQRKPQRDQVGE